MVKSSYVICILACALIGGSAGAAQPTKPEQPRYRSVEPSDHSSDEPFEGVPPVQEQNFFGGLGYDYFDSFGLQARYALRVLTDGLFEGLNDPIYLEGGLGLTVYGDTKGKKGVTGFNFVVTGRWDFQLDQAWVFFAGAGFGFNAISSGLLAEDVAGGGFFPAIGVGAVYNLTPEWGLRADVSYQFLGAGLTHRF